MASTRIPAATSTPAPRRPGPATTRSCSASPTTPGPRSPGAPPTPRLLPVVNTASGQATTDQWWQWTGFTPKGTLVSSYYDRQYGSAETTGDMDFSVSTSMNLSSFQVRRATSASMPLPTQFPDTQGNSQFIGDYTGMSSVSGAHPIWADTRNPDAFVCPGTAAPCVPPALCTTYTLTLHT